MIGAHATEEVLIKADLSVTTCAGTLITAGAHVKITHCVIQP